MKYNVENRIEYWFFNFSFYPKFLRFYRTFPVINPTNEPYEFIFESVLFDKPELIPVHCNMLKGYVEGGTSTDVTFTFSPTAPGVCYFIFSQVLLNY